MYHLIPSSTNLYWPSTSQYRYILTQYHQVPLIIHHLVRHSSVNWIIPLYTTHLMSHAQYTWSSFLLVIVLSYQCLHSEWKKRVATRKVVFDKWPDLRFPIFSLFLSSTIWSKWQSGFKNSVAKESWQDLLENGCLLLCMNQSNQYRAQETPTHLYLSHTSFSCSSYMM